jgi:hypothetical protein
MMEKNTESVGEEPKMAIEKRIVPFDQSEPDTEPLFINFVQASHAAGSAYLDVGIIPLDEILARKDGYTFHVLTRLVMSKETMVAMKDQIIELLEGMAGHDEIAKVSSKA